MTSTVLDARRPYTGRFVSWGDACMFIGRGGGLVPEHAHYAIQVAFGIAPGVRFRTGEREPWIEYAGAIIPSRHPHAMDATAVHPNVVLFVEPESRQGRAIAERHLRGGIASMDAALHAALTPPLFAAYEAGDYAGVQAATERVLHALTGGVAPSVVTDERILRAVAHVRAHLDAPLSLEVVADVACLSPSRFRHLFVEQTGMALRPYILWRRLLRVWELLMDGATLSSAAHAAGFADAAHLSRTSKAMFGFPPSAMIMAAKA